MSRGSFDATCSQADVAASNRNATWSFFNDPWKVAGSFRKLNLDTSRLERVLAIAAGLDEPARANQSQLIAYCCLRASQPVAVLADEHFPLAVG
jgi:hypothetical protein